jgi:hypothetical protein
LAHFPKQTQQVHKQTILLVRAGVPEQSVEIFMSQKTKGKRDLVLQADLGWDKLFKEEDSANRQNMSPL